MPEAEIRLGKACHTILDLFQRKRETQSYPIQDEPEGEVRFQYKMSLKGR
jgi:hypothetical protein